MSFIAVNRDSDAAPVRSRVAVSRRRLAITALCLAAIGGAFWYGHGWWVEGRFIETTDDAYVGGDVTEISPHVAGFVAALLVTDNQNVRAGQLIARLDRRDFQAAYERAQAVVNERVAGLANLRAQYLQQQSIIHQADADRQAKIASASFARLEKARYATLAVTSAGSRQDAQKTAAAQTEADAVLASAQANLEAAQRQLEVIDTQTARAQAELAQARAELQTASLNLGYTDIRAPIEGYVGNRAAHVGAYVGAGAYLLSIIPAHGLWVDANFKEDQLARLAVGQAATATADAAPGQSLHGHVVSLAPGTGAVFSVIPPENATGNFTKIVQRVPVRIALDDADSTLGRLRPGLSIVVRVDTRGGK